jgi:hypothetical protein
VALSDHRIDATFVGVYRNFIEGLRNAQDGVIAARHEFFLMEDASEANLAKARLLGCILGLNRSLFDEILGLAFGFQSSSSKWRRCKEMAGDDSPDRLSRILEGACSPGPGWPTDLRIVVRLLAVLEHTRGSPAWKLFGSGRPRPRVVLKFEHTPFSMTSGFNQIACVDFDREWAVVLNWALDHGFLPLILGFVLKNDLVANVVRLSLRLGDAPFMTGSFEIQDAEIDEGDRLLFACLQDEKRLTILEFLLRLSQTERRAFSGADLNQLEEAASSIAGMQQHEEGVFDSDRLFERFGRPTSPLALDALKDRLADELKGRAFARISEAARRPTLSKKELERLTDAPSPRDAESAARLLLHFARQVVGGRPPPSTSQSDEWEEGGPLALAECRFLAWCLTKVGERAIERARALNASLADELIVHVRWRVQEASAAQFSPGQFGSGMAGQIGRGLFSTSKRLWEEIAESFRGDDLQQF